MANKAKNFQSCKAKIKLKTPERWEKKTRNFDVIFGNREVSKAYKYNQNHEYPRLLLNFRDNLIFRRNHNQNFFGMFRILYPRIKNMLIGTQKFCYIEYQIKRRKASSRFCRARHAAPAPRFFQYFSIEFLSRFCRARHAAAAAKT